jgi:LysM repeat protein
VTESDVNTGSITNLATARAGNTPSNQTGITLTRGTPAPSGVLTLAKTASTQTYGAANETITFMFNITNTGATPLGPAQFTVTDNKLGAPFNCGPANTTLAPSQSVSCSVPYIVTAADMGQANITNSAVAAGAGQTSAAATVTVVNLLAPATATPPTPVTNTPSSPSNLAPGSTIQHNVAVGEWLIQIGRCYGANFEELRDANPQIANPNFILPSMRVTVPRLGSSGRIYGPPCVTFHTVQSGETFESLAQRYNADLTVLRLVNPGGLVVGQQAKIPLNSAGGGGVVVTAIPPTSGVTPGVTGIPPMRISFDAGSTTASRTGFINPGQTLQYLVNAQQGQTLTLQLTAPPNEVSMGVTGPTGLALKPNDSNYTWTAAVLNTGDHTINLASLTGGSSKSYTLQVSLTNATPATATNTPTTPVP